MADAKSDTKARAPKSTRYRYVDTFERVFVDVPITVAPGDVVDWPGGPPDQGRWEETDQPVSRHPDNRE